VKLTFVETPVFTKLITGLLTDTEYSRLQEHLLICPTAGDLIVATAGCRKIRWRVSGRKGGKSGGMRVIYYYRSARDQIIFLLAYDHRAMDDLSSVQKRQLARVVRQLK
jgi:mRNA-degrading endonuclease RelE of RelBE toxin-antitoxin system